VEEPGRNEPVAETEELPVGPAPDEEVLDPGELRARLGIKDGYIKELCEELARSRLAADEARVAREVGERRIADLEEERNRLAERVRTLEEEARGRWWRRDREERRLSRLARELEGKDAEISRRDDLLERRSRELAEREEEAAELRAAMEALRRETQEELRLARPETRLRAGVELFNESEQLRAVGALSRSMGEPEVHVALGEGEERPVVLSFTWQGIAWQTYSVDPNRRSEETRVRLVSSGEDLSGVDAEPPNAGIDPDGRVRL
jgi:ribonuclease Y